MFDPALFLAFVGAVVVLMLIPGPNVSLIVANSVTWGPRYGFLTLAGTASAMLVQLGLTAFGMAHVLGGLGIWFEWLRWAGVGYLLYLGVRQWCAPAVDLTGVRPQPRSVRSVYMRGLLVSLTNPKTLFFYGAFFPQFIRPDRPIGLQVAVLSATFLVIAVLVDSGWALLAGRARRVLASRGRLRNRISGGCLMGAGAALALARNR